MDVESPLGSRRIRARRIGVPTSLAERGAYRIEDEHGEVLRKIRDVRNAEEAIALYWRALGTAMPGAMMSKDLDRRISRARAGIGRAAMQTPELPFGLDPDANPADSAPDAARTSKRGGATRPAESVPQTDLFAEEPTVDATDEAFQPAEAIAAEPEPPGPEPEPEREPEREPEPHVLDAQAVMLQRVDPRNLRPTDRPDSYLYHVTNGPDAEAALTHGLSVSVSDPIILTERPGVAYWLSVLAEDYDYILDGPADFVVLRLRRVAVEDLLEHDPHASRSAGCACYLLTGGIAARQG
jgi:hypothetical protein